MMTFNISKALNLGWLLLIAGTCFGVLLSVGLLSGEGSAEGQSGTAVGRPQVGLPETEMRVAGKRYRLEIASTPEQAETGLMYRTVLPVGHGMLFRFDAVRPVAFWMKNTKIPLDMLFVRANQVVHIAHNAQPCLNEPCPVYPSEQPVDMVIELPGGTAKKDLILDGARIQWAATANQPKQTVKSAITKKQIP